MSDRARLGGSNPAGIAVLPRNLLRALAIFALIAGELGPLSATPTRAVEPGDDAVADQRQPTGPDGDVIEAKPAPITTPTSGGSAAGELDPSIGGPPLFLPYTAPADVAELADKRTRETRTLAHPDGTFTLEASNGPLNYLDTGGAWQPIDLSLVADGDDGYRVAANAGTTRIGTKDGALGSIEVDGHAVSLRAPGYFFGDIGTELDQNRVTFADAAGKPALWVRPVDIGLEFGATWSDASQDSVVQLVLDPGDLVPQMAEDKRSIVFADADGKFAGRIDAPILREGGEDGAPILDQVSVFLAEFGDGTWFIEYHLDQAWLADPKRVFPVILDPTWCIGGGASGAGCDSSYSPNSNDTFIYNADPDGYEVGWTVTRTGYDVRSDDGGTYNKMRTMLYFPPVSLGDGAVIFDTDLQVKTCCLYGGAQGQTVWAYRLTKSLTTPFTWNRFNDEYITTDGVSDTVPASGDMHWDVDGIVSAWYTKTHKAARKPHGFMLRMDTESSGNGEVEFRRYNNGTLANRPLLTISYTVPKFGLDFDPRLGPTYAPTSMVTSLPTKLPITIENKTGSAHDLDMCVGTSDSDCWKVGYRWFDSKGYQVGGGDTASTADLPANVAVGATSSLFKITVTPPATTGQYTLRLDLVHKFGRLWWASDYATPSKYFSRNKKMLTASSTRWTGTSAIERAEFGINVSGGAGAGAVEGLAVPSGGELGIDLYSKNLSYAADTGLGFADRLPLSLTYGYNEAVAETCSGYQGILGACGWFTNWDERITGGANQTGFDYTYVDPSGTPYMLDTDPDGQVAGGASVLINRPRVTVIAENGGWDGSDAGTTPDVQAVLATAESPAFSAFAGQYVGKAPSNATKAINGPDKITLNTYRKARFAVRTTSTTGAASAGLCFQIHNLTDSDEYPDRWFCYTVGSTWTTGFDQVNLGLQSGVTSLKGNWNYYIGDLYEHVRNDADFGTPKDDYQVIGIQVQSSSAGNGGSTYVDGFRFEPLDTVLLDDTDLAWTSGDAQATLNSTDYVFNTKSTQVTPGSGITPQCKASNGCWNTANPGLWAYAFADWYWKKLGGQTAAMVFYLHNTRPGGPCNATDCTLAYYAGAAPNFTSHAAIRVDPFAPATWTLVRRNLLEDARQALNLYDDAGDGSGDEVEITGWAPVAVDGGSLLVDRLAYGNLADTSGIDPTGPDSAGLPGQQYQPDTPGDPAFTYDFTADYPGGSRHYFNRDGLLIRIRDRDRQAIELDWTFDAATAGPAAYALTAIRAPGDGTSSGGVTFNRQFTVTRGTDGSLSTIRFDEDLGVTPSTDSSSRAVIFETSAASGGDLVKVNPARNPVPGAICGSRPNGCVEFTYSGSSHRLQYVIDPRWTGATTGSADYRLEVARDGSNKPDAILDRSHGGAALLKVLTFSDTRDATLLYNRPLFQDAAARAAGAAIATDLNPDGAAMTRYIARSCAGIPPSCALSTDWPGTGAQGDHKAVDYLFDGLSRVNSVKTYRCPISTGAVPGCTAGELLTLSRTEANAAAKIDNYADPLAGGQLLWRASADQVFASLRDSGGTNPDLYRTEYRYDGRNEVSETIEVRQLEASNYVDTVKLNGPAGYWRLNETSGIPMVDSSGFNRNGSYTNTPTLGVAGGLIRDPANKATLFNGTDESATVTAATMGTISGSFSVAAWVQSTDGSPNAQAFVGSRGPSEYGFNAKLCSVTCSQGKGIRIDVGSGSAWLLNGTVPFEWQKERWYHVAVAVSGPGNRATLYVDGNLLGALSFTTAGTPVLTNATHSLYFAQNGLAATPERFKGYIDEAAVYASALPAAEVFAHYRAGRAVATVDTTVIRDAAGRPVEQASAVLANPGFEQSSDGWTLGSLASIGAPGHTSAASLTAAIGATTQIAQLAPGQAFRLQFATKAAASTSVNVKLESNTAGTWTVLGGLNNSYTETAWTIRAFDVRLPTDADGRVRISLSKTGGGTASVDDVILVTGWSRTAYESAVGIGLGLPTDWFTLATCATGPCSSSTTRLQLSYAAGTSGPGYHPAVFATKSIANYQDGSQGPGFDDDVTSQVTFDSWGRQRTSIDPDGVDSLTVYAANQTDVAETRDGLDNPTLMAYDLVGNATSTTSPLGRPSASTYDFRNQGLTATGPDGVVSRTDYNDYGQATATWANYVNGVVESTDSDDTDDLLSVSAYDRFGQRIQSDVECGSVGACATGGLDARTTTTYDLLGNVVSTTAYPATNGGGTPRTTVNHFETYDPPGATEFGALLFSRTSATGIQLAIAPSGGLAPMCPGSATVRCNSVTTLDAGGRAIVSTDAYGVATRSVLDLDGRAVETTANYVAGGGQTSDQNVVTSTEYNVLGDPVVAWDEYRRRDEMLYDALGRLIETAHLDAATPTAVEYLHESTEYLPSGRISRTFDGSAWTKTVYDGAGRAVQTIANHDQGGNAGMTLEAFESGTGAWSKAASTFFTTADAPAMTSDVDAGGNGYTTVPPVSGRGRLHLTTHATSGSTGTWLELTSGTFKASHTYKAMFDLRASAAGLSLTAYLGQDQSGGSYGQAAISSTTGWSRYAVTWTPGSDQTSGVRFALTKPAAGTAEIYLDNLVVWDTTSGWTDTGIVSSVSAYNADGEIAASVVPPGDPNTEWPLVTTVGFDPAGRGAATAVNGVSGAYVATILGTANLAAYVPLDERAGAIADRKSGAPALGAVGGARLGLAGGIDEARTAVGVTNGSYVSRGSNATASTTNVSMEAWIRSDAASSQTVVVAANGTATNGWGIGLDSTGKAAGFALSGSTLTTMASDTAANDSRWHHVVLTRGASTWAMTLDGVAKTLTNNTAAPGTPGAGFSIGALPDGSRPVTGEVDEVAVYTADISGSTATAHWAAGRRTDATSAITERTAYDRLGRPTDTWAADLVRSRVKYDRLGNQVETVRNHLDGTTTGGTAADDVRSTFAYDVLGELIGYCPAVEVKLGGCDPASASEVQAWHYEFDALGRQIKTIAPDNTAVTDLATQHTVYEAGGRVEKTCAYPAGGSCGAFDSRHADFTYDKLGRILTQKTWDRGASPAADTLKFTKTLTWRKDGSPESVAEGSDTLSYLYDTAGRQSELKRGATVLTSYAYTPATSTIATRTDGAMGATVFTYDWARRATVVDPPDSFVAGTVTRSYRLDGLLASQAFPSSITETLAYDAVKRPTSISLGSAGSLSQAFDRAGRITSEGRSLTGISGDAGTGSQSFAYDGLSRLTSSSGLAVNRSYQYDLDGNRTRRVEGATTTDFTYDRADQFIKQTIAGTDRFSAYDRYGNLLSSSDATSATTTYAFDEANRLTAINPPGGAPAQITFTMDALDRHKDRKVGGTTTDTYAYLDATETAWETGTGTTTQSLLDADGTRLAIKTGATVRWLVFDLHGSVTALCTAGTSTISDAYRFDGWGQQIASAGSATNPFRYRGLLNIGADALVGALLDMNARDYSPQLGTFTQFDTVQGSVANPMTMNRYLYALANPATLVDPDGHSACEMDPCSGGARAIPTAGGHRIVQPLKRQSSSSQSSSSPAPAVKDLADGPAPWGPPDLDVWMSQTDAWRNWYTSMYWMEALAWNGWGNNEESILAYWILGSGLAGTPEALRTGILLPPGLSGTDTYLLANALPPALSIYDQSKDSLIDPRMESRVLDAIDAHPAGTFETMWASLGILGMFGFQPPGSAGGGGGSPPQLVAGRIAEAQFLDRGGLSKNTTLFRPSAAQASSPLFREVVGTPRYTPGGQLVGTIVDTLGAEYKSGTSRLSSSYQLRLQVYRALVTGNSWRLVTTRPITQSFANYLKAWGMPVDRQ